MSAVIVRRKPCPACRGTRTHEVWGLGPTEPVRLIPCFTCRGHGHIEAAPIASVALVARPRVVPGGSPCTKHIHGVRS